MKLVKAAGFTTIVFGLLVLPACSRRSRIISGQPPVSGKSSVTGSVVAADGKPVENAVVYLCFTEGESLMIGCMPSDRLAATRTNSSGIFWFRNIPPGEYFPVVRITESSQMVLQEKRKGEYLPSVVKYKVNADETMQIAPIKLEKNPEKEAEGIRLTYPADGAGRYLVKLFKLSKTTRPVAGHTFEDTELEDIDVPGKFFLGEVAIETNSVKILKDLADGQYFLRVTAIVTTDDRDEKAISAPALGFTSKDDGYFTAAGAATKK